MLLTDAVLTYKYLKKIVSKIKINDSQTTGDSE